MGRGAVMVTGIIELRPDNGSSPHVVRLRDESGLDLWFAYPTRERAEAKLPKLLAKWNEGRGVP